MTVIPEHPHAGWVDAAPFRAHVRFLMAVGSLSAADLATAAGVSTAVVRGLLATRGGIRARRLSPDTARRLLALSAQDVRGMRWQLVPSHRARARLETLRQAGLSDAQIAELARIGVSELDQLAPQSQHCSALLSMRIVAAARTHSGRQSTVRARRTALPVAA